jgi:hypothetical protein
MEIFGQRRTIFFSGKYLRVCLVKGISDYKVLTIEWNCNQKHYPGTYLSEMSKTTRKLNHDSLHHGRDSNRIHLEYNSEAYPLDSALLLENFCKKVLAELTM